jgi:methionine sulfoxide reductase heme-binding subunit
MAPPRDLRFAKLVVFVNALVPLALLAWDALHHHLGANPIELITRSTGTLTLVFLTLSLAVTPARKLLGMAWLVKFRRMLGLWAFFYACLHLLTYVWLDQFFNLRAIATDAVTRPFISFGLLAFAFMVPLALTSTQAAVRRLGGPRWQRIHRRVYLVGALAIVHYWLEVKADTSKPLAFAVVLGLLLFWRFVYRTKTARE